MTQTHTHSEDAEEGGEVNYLECEEASGYLTFNREVQRILAS